MALTVIRRGSGRKTASARIGPRFMPWMEALTRNLRYADVLLLDRQGKAGALGRTEVRRR